MAWCETLGFLRILCSSSASRNRFKGEFHCLCAQRNLVGCMSNFELYFSCAFKLSNRGLSIVRTEIPLLALVLLLYRVHCEILTWILVQKRDDIHIF